MGAGPTKLPCPLRDRAVADPSLWLARHRGRVSATRVFTFYDHPILGRPRGRIVLVRFTAPTRVPGALYYALTPRGRSAPAAACASR
jgi:hypothetical protein